MTVSTDAPRSPEPSSDIARLVEIMAWLRTPGKGCPWDLEQSFETIAPYTIEEAYEVADAITRGDFSELKDELGDLLLQVVFHARMAEERGLFAFPDVVRAITEKLIRRHPHVFGSARDLPPDAVKALWGEIKREEKRQKAEARAKAGLPPLAEGGVLSGIPAALPGLTRALKLQDKAGQVGFDWNNVDSVLDKIVEEANEIVAARRAGEGTSAIAGEIGDLLFAVVNLARHLDIDPEAALRATNAKFERRFGVIEDRLAAAGRKPAEASLDEMDALWNEAKAAERAAKQAG
ncbi:nucleoside triphosphate pyrophosphohydrolase [Phreatobacter sp. AB_2022a]|uniref:nucleoside triphosphate pyrophosphohydrolase n=1 Tax=Phreatobacter sp. AB_2022a TaxID=3003134 RepID=UPI0022876386|nr:nucleoside triphosphate pyrophosphohydrolase [Phreatobacter sp. AB_2022a]MCZ0736539.1 nucleoside triphosphate pyrophosphohydrolase [Phreatobacter sp. AB_2022a]